MSAPAPLCDVIDATWPAARRLRCGPFVLRDGQGGGLRVCAATLARPGDRPDAAMVADAECAMRDMGQRPVFALRPGDEGFDGMLAARGYGHGGQVMIRACRTGRLARALPRLTVFAVQEPLAIMRDIWARAGIGPAQQAIMARVAGPRTGLLGRHGNRPAAAAFVAVHGGMGMIHALTVLPALRGRGIGGWMLRAAAHWARGQGARLLLALTAGDTGENRGNTHGADAFFDALGLRPVGGFHYRLGSGTAGSGRA